VSGIAEHVAAIAGAAEEQSVSLAEINTAMNQLDQVTQHNAAMFEQTTAASMSLKAQTDGLDRAMAQFRIGLDVTAPAGRDDWRQDKSA
jgi:methyl-accepting chemotaxis protein